MTVQGKNYHKSPSGAPWRNLARTSGSFERESLSNLRLLEAAREHCAILRLSKFPLPQRGFQRWADKPHPNSWGAISCRCLDVPERSCPLSSRPPSQWARRQRGSGHGTNVNGLYPAPVQGSSRGRLAVRTTRRSFPPHLSPAFSPHAEICTVVKG